MLRGCLESVEGGQIETIDRTLENVITMMGRLVETLVDKGVVGQDEFRYITNDHDSTAKLVPDEHNGQG